MAPTQRHPSRAQHETSEIEHDDLVARLVDEAEYWKGAAERLEGVVNELRAERDRLRGEGELADLWRQGLAAEALDLAAAHAREQRPKADNALAAFVVALPLALVLWALVGLLAYAGYRMAG